MNADTQKFADEVIRPMCDVLLGLLTKPNDIVQAFAAKNIYTDCGFTLAQLTSQTPLTQGDYDAVQTVTLSANDGRTPITNKDIFAAVRLMAWFNAAINSDPEVVALIRKIAVNPRVL